MLSGEWIKSTQTNENVGRNMIKQLNIAIMTLFALDYSSFSLYFTQHF